MSRKYWRSLDDLADSPEFRQALDEQLAPLVAEQEQSSRRGFLKLMGASLGLAGMAGCIRLPEEKLAPYARAPADRTPGTPVSYATAMELGGVAQGLLVTSYDGRPIKIEGNPSHPLNRGATDAIAQASILELYDPDRSRGVIRRQGGSRTVSSWEEFCRWAKETIPADGEGVFVLSEATWSPSVLDMRTRLREEMPHARWDEYESASMDNVRQGLRVARGRVQAVASSIDLSVAEVILSLDADLFGGGHPAAVKNARDFAARRRLHGPGNSEMNRLYVVEPTYTITGASADHRRAAPASAIWALAVRLAAMLGILPDGSAAEDAKLDESIGDVFLATVHRDLEEHHGRSIVVAGAGQPPAVHALVAAINNKLGNTNKTVVYCDDPNLLRDAHIMAFSELSESIERGEVKTLVILGGNPVYDAPSNVDFAKVFAKVPNSIHLAVYEDETSHLCQWHISRTHFLEAWGDARTIDGTASLVQPLIEPLFEGHSAIELLAVLARDQQGIGGGGYEIVRRTFHSLVGEKESAEFPEWKWKQALAQGIVEGTAWKPVPLEVDKETIAEAVNQRPVPDITADTCELVFYTDGKVYDGRFANNGWLQELPDPMTRLTWDNAALMSPKTAERLGVGRDEVVRLSVVCPSGDDVEVEAPAMLIPGMAEGVVGLALGYGRTSAGSVGDKVGVNAYKLRTVDSLGWQSGVTVTPTGKRHRLATVQDHHIVDAVGRRAVQERIPELIREGSRDQYQKDPALGHAKKAALSIYNEHSLDGRPADGSDASHVPEHEFHRWGLAIDLTACTGCGACVVACQAENNIPIVGREQVLHGREMHWLRIDRYFRETPEAAVAVHQPVMCMQCENAPCEQVCPVAATTHSQEGLNMMTYNRCVGTRYCANNCPYKVRRFNYFDYNRGAIEDLYVPNAAREPVGELLKMQKNPEVTVRMRGVMEKCTYCVQRIENARIAAKRDGRPLRDGEVQTACQQACPARAIVFGDLNDAASRVSRLLALPRAYGMLDEQLRTKPRTQYLAKVRNTVEGLG